mgnify:CR=1 FL=1
MLDILKMEITDVKLKSDYFRIEIKLLKRKRLKLKKLKSDYFRIEICLILLEMLIKYR